jgi:hypothetical protein
MHDDSAGGDLRIGDWIPAPRRESLPLTLGDEPPTTAGQAEPPPPSARHARHAEAPAPAAPATPPAPATPYGEPSPAPRAPIVMRRTEPVPPVPGWVESEETVALPAFLRGVPAPGIVAAATDPTTPLATLLPPLGGLTATGRHAAIGGHTGAHALPAVTEPPAAEPDAEDGRDGLPASERNMLIFVCSLLAAGTLAIVAMGHGALNKHTGTSPTIVASPTAPAGQTYVGSPDVSGYCEGLDGHLTSRPPGTGHTEWSCTGAGHVTVTFTPTDVCRAQFGPSAHATYVTLTETKTWRCLR